MYEGAGIFFKVARPRRNGPSILACPKYIAWVKGLGPSYGDRP